MRNLVYSTVTLFDLQKMPFHEVLPLIVNLDERSFWWLIDWLASSPLNASGFGENEF